MIKKLPLAKIYNLAQTFDTNTTRTCTSSMENYNRYNDTKSGKISQNVKRIQTLPLTSCPGKLCESTVNEHLVNHCEKTKPVPRSTIFYRSGRGTTDNLLTLTEKATRSFEWKGATAAAFLDIEQAFDSIWIKGILYKQIQIKTPWWITIWTSSFLSNRNIKVK